MPNTPTVAVLGLGSMGHAFAANLLKKGFPTRVWNRSRDRAGDLEREGTAVGGSPREAAAEADVVISMLPNGEVTGSVLLGEQGALAGLRQDGVLAQMGTIGVEATARLVEAARAQRPDVAYVDAPVSGTKAPAEQGQVVVLASGERAAAAAVEPVFAAIGKATHWLGEAGAGSRMKLVVNAWLATMVQGVAESALLANRLGFAPGDLWRVLEGGPLAAPFVKLKLEAIAKEDFAPQFALDLALKDCRLALQAAGGRPPLPILERIAELWSEAVDAGLGKDDVEGVHRYLARA